MNPRDRHKVMRSLKGYDPADVHAALDSMHNRNAPPVVTGPGGDYRKAYTPPVNRSPLGRFLVGVMWGAPIGAVLVTLYNFLLYAWGYLGSQEAGALGLAMLLSAIGVSMVAGVLHFLLD